MKVLFDQKIQMAQSMGKTAQTMAKMNKQMDPQKMAKTLAQFERENMKMEMSGEMMDDAMGKFFAEIQLLFVYMGVTICRRYLDF